MDFAASALAFAALAAYSASAWGWGRLLLGVCRVEEGSGFAYPAVLGLAALAAIGGWLNLLGIAYAPALLALLAGGWIVAGRRAWRAGLPRLGALRPALLVPACAIAIVALLLVLFLLPTRTFNPFDDLQMYFPRPVRMLQTGALAGNPFDLLGLDSLGSHAFLQAFILAVLPPGYFNAFDAVLCAVLSLGLVMSIGAAIGAGVAAVLAGLAALVVLPPLQVNVSSVYGTAAFVLALAPAARHLMTSKGAVPVELVRTAVPTGLLLAALAGSKSTSLSFLVPFAVLLPALAAATDGRRHAARATLAAAGWSGAFIAPRIALHARSYFDWLAGPARVGSPELASSTSAFFAHAKPGWPGAVMEFNLVALVPLAAAVLAASRWRRKGAAERRAALPLVALCGAASIAYLLNALLPIQEHNVWRYSAPALLAAVAAAALLLAISLPPLAAAPAAACVPLAVILLIGDLAAERARNPVVERATARFPPRFQAFSTLGLAPEGGRWMRRVQARVPAAERVLVLVAFPYQLLFARNPVLTASEAGLPAPWLRLPLDADASRIRDFLRSHGVRYVVWQTGPYSKLDEENALQMQSPAPAARISARYLMSFRKSLAELAGSGRVVETDHGVIVIDLGND
jgi:hypothetical protein